MKLFCFPYAGGSASMYVKWKKHFTDQLDIVPIEYAGRASRADEPHYSSFQELVGDVTKIVIDNLRKDQEFALFGYSMGSLVAYEVYKQIQNLGYQAAKHIFFAARESPGTKTLRVAHLPDKEFINTVYNYDGMSDQLYHNKEMLDYFLPILRADFINHETYQFKEEESKIDCDFTIFHGTKDKSVQNENIIKWRNFTDKHVQFIAYDSSHFFIKDFETEILNIISDKLLLSKYTRLEHFV